MANEVAQATVGLGIDRGAFESSLLAAVTGGSTAAAGKMASIFKAAAPIAAITGIGAAFFEIGSKFDEQFDKIQTRTGATGKALQGLQTDFKNVFSTAIGATFTNVGDALSEITVRTGLVGKPLEDLTRKFVELGHITGTDVKTDVDAATAAFNAFGVPVAEQSKALDILFKATQVSGTGFGDLTSQVQAAIPVAKAMGFTFGETAALVANLSSAGLPAQKVMQGLAKEFTAAAKAGEDPIKTVGALFDRIKKAPSDTDAAALAMQTFGLRAGPQLATAIRSGRLDLDKTLKLISDSKGGIDETALAVADFGEKWGILKNKVITALEPAGSAVFNFAGTIMDKFSEKGAGGVISYLWTSIETATPKIIAAFGRWAGAAWDWVKDVWPKLVNGLDGLITSISTWTKTNWPKFKEWVDHAWDWLVQAAKDVAVKVGEFITAVETWVKDNWPKFASWVDHAWDWLVEAAGKVAAKIGEFVGTVETFVSTYWPVFLGWVDHAWDWLTEAAGKVAAKIGEFKSAIENWAQTNWPKFAAWAGKVWDWLVDAAKDVGKSMLKLLGAISGWSSTHGKEIGEKGGELVARMVLGIHEWVVSHPKEIGEAALAIVAALAIGMVAVPVVLTVAAATIIAGFLQGLVTEMAKGIASATKSVSGWIRGWFVDAGGWLLDKGGAVLSGLWGGLRTAWDASTNWFTGIMDNVVGKFSGAGGWLLQTGRDIIWGLVDGIGTMGEAIARAVVSVIPGPIKSLLKYVPGIGDLLKKYSGKSQDELSAEGAANAIAGRVKGNAAGTMNFAGGMSWVGERGPELLNIPRGSQIIPFETIAKLGAKSPGGDNYTINVTNVDPQRMPADIIRELRDQVFLQSVA